MILLSAEQLKTIVIGSKNYKQNQSLKAKDLLEFFRKESDEEIIPTLPEDLATNFYNKNFLETEQYICLEEDNSIQAFWSWFWLDNPQDGLSTRGSWDIPTQSTKRDVLFVTPLCISKKYQRKTNWWPLIQEFLPNHKTLSFERKNKLIIIKG
jgi:hypothetical protein